MTPDDIRHNLQLATLSRLPQRQSLDDLQAARDDAFRRMRMLVIVMCVELGALILGVGVLVGHLLGAW